MTSGIDEAFVLGTDLGLFIKVDAKRINVIDNVIGRSLAWEMCTYHRNTSCHDADDLIDSCSLCFLSGN